MKKFITVFALAIALPAVGYAQVAPTPGQNMNCGEKMKAAGKDCCKDMAAMDHGKMDHSKMVHGTQSAPQPQPPQSSAPQQ